MNLVLEHEWIWILSFGLTLLIEVGVMLGCRYWCRMPWASNATGPLVLAVFALNFVTHPMAWQAGALGVPWMLNEIGVVLFEAVGLFLIVPGVRRWDVAKWSIWMNAASAMVGLGLGGILE